MKTAQLKILSNLHPNWEHDPILALMDTILSKNQELYNIVKKDYLKVRKDNGFGRQDSPSLEQVVRGALYMILKNLDYEKLEYAQFDSKICEAFLKLDLLHSGYTDSTWQKYISGINAETLTELKVEINKIFIQEGFENLSKIREDSTVVQCNIRYPTNNNLVWDCIREAHSILNKIPYSVLRKLGIKIRNYKKQAKRNHFTLNVAKTGSKKYKETFILQLGILLKSIHQLQRIIFLLEGGEIYSNLSDLESFLPVMEKVYTNSRRHEILGEKVENKDKIFSIYEQHTDIIVKGGRDPEFGHKVNLTSGSSSLILYCETLDGNPSDTKLFKPTLDKILASYGTIPGSFSGDGGYASLDNLKYALKKGIKNIVFTKVVGSLQNIVSSKKMETILKKWRSGMEAIISNLKRGFNLRKVYWKGREHFDAKVLWSVIVYNFRVITSRILEQLVLEK